MRLRILALVAGMLVVTGVSAFAQNDSKGDVAFSYVVMKDKDVDGFFPNGWMGAVAGRVSRSVDIVGEFGRSSKTASDDASGISVSLSLINYVAGPRFASRASSAVMPFVQVLAGGVRAKGTLVSCGAFLTGAECDQARSASPSINGFALQPGAGVDVMLAGRAGLRLQGDYRYIRAEGENGNEYRFAAGVVIRF